MWPANQVADYMKETALHRAQWIRANGTKSIEEITCEFPRLLDTPGMVGPNLCIFFQKVRIPFDGHQDGRCGKKRTCVLQEYIFKQGNQFACTALELWKAEDRALPFNFFKYVNALLISHFQISQDFSVLFPDHAERLFQTWKMSFKDKILCFASQEKKAQELLHNLDNLSPGIVVNARTYSYSLE